MQEDAPVADERYEVRQGDCISSLADVRGLKWQTLWDHNPELKALRKNPNALQPGDMVLIPPKQLRYEDRPTDQRHEFVREGFPAKFRVILEKYDEPLANKRWNLSVDGRVYSGSTDSKGLLEIVLPPDAHSGHLVLPEENLEYDLSFGHLDPIETISGAQARLENLGFYQGTISGEMDEETRDAILSFQTAHGLPATGELDGRTRTELEQRHDCQHSQPAAESYVPPAETPGEDDHPEEVTHNEAEDQRRFQQFEQLDEEEQ